MNKIQFAGQSKQPIFRSFTIIYQVDELTTTKTDTVVFFFFACVSVSFDSSFRFGVSSCSSGFLTVSVSGFFAAGSPLDERRGFPRLPGVGLGVGAAGVEVIG